uniref:WW domain-containing protein n=1 Tax=Panagrellus redivivus TaxID=6233 RepID=A0A7E4ZZG0_PANRE
MSSSPTYTAKFGPWLEMVSSKGKIYYYNRITSTSQWTKPPEWVESATAAKEKEKTITPPPAPPILSQPPPAPSISVNSNETPLTTTTTAVEPVQNGITATPIGSTNRDEASADRQGSEKRPISALSRSKSRSRSRSQRRPMSISRSTSRSSRSPPSKRQRTYTSSERSVGSYRSYRRRSSLTSSRTQSRGSNSTYRRDLSSEKGSVPMDVSPGSSPEPTVMEVAPAAVEEVNSNNIEDNKDASNVTEDSREASPPSAAPLVNGHSKPKIVSTTNFDDLSDGEYEKPEADADFFTDEQLDGILLEHGTSFVPQFLPAVVEMNKEMTALALKHAEIAQELLEVVKDRISITQMITATEIVCEGVEARAKFCKEQADLLSDGI